MKEMSFSYRATALIELLQTTPMKKCNSLRQVRDAYRLGSSKFYCILGCRVKQINKLCKILISRCEHFEFIQRQSHKLPIIVSVLCQSSNAKKAEVKHWLRKPIWQRSTRNQSVSRTLVSSALWLLQWSDFGPI